MPYAFRLLAFLFVLAPFVVPSPAAAQRELPPALFVQEPSGKLEPLGVSRVDVRARVYGFLAETRMTLTFSNPNSRALAGDLYFPLPEGATVSGYGLDIHGQLIDGVAVGKDEARVIFEKEVRKGIDPGLVEWTKGNNFKTRVFPIPARGTRTVAVSYVHQLEAKGQAYLYDLPLFFKEAVGEFNVRVDVRTPPTAGAPKATWDGPGRVNVRQQGGVFEAAAKKKPIRGHLVVQVPRASNDDLLVERGPDGALYWAALDVPKDPRSAQARSKVTKPRRVGVVWDASLSRGTVKHTRELEVLSAYLDKLGGNVRIDVALLRNTLSSTKTFRDAASVVKALEGVTYDGATQLGALEGIKRSRADLYLVFSDGLSNFGQELPASLGGPVYTFSKDPRANHGVLRYLAQQSGGQYFNLARQSTRAVVDGIGTATFSYLSTKGAGETYPTSATPVRERRVVTGRIERAKDATAVLSFGLPGAPLISKKHLVSAREAKPGRLLSTFWAQRKVTELAVLPSKFEVELRETGKAFGLVTPFTSLLVLETLDQYLEHDVRPPKSLVTMRRQWDAEIERRRVAKVNADKEKLSSVIDMWNDRVKWWETKFKYPKGYRHGGDKNKKRSRRAGGGPPASAAPADGVANEDSVDMEMAEADSFNGGGEPEPESKAKESSAEGDSGGGGIEISSWDPDTPYIRELKKASRKKRLEVYLAQRQTHGTSPAFFLDVADFFFKNKEPALALRVLSNVAELELENAALLRVLGYKLATLKRWALAQWVFEQVLRMRPEEPQSYRDLALVLEQQKDYRRAMELLAHVVMNTWDRFDQIELIALTELNRIVPEARRAGVRDIPVDRRLVKLLDMDVRIALSWDTDLTDIDLWVIEPSGQKAYYGDNRTRIGGLVSRDFTQGYGPEVYLLRRAMEGEYKVQVNFYGSQAQTLTGAVTLQLDLYTNYGRPNEKHETITVRLNEKSETLTIGKLKF